MRILIVEDETAAYENLLEILKEIEPETEIAGYTESISQTVRWLKNNSMPDLILMDIHLSDGSAFSIFNKLTIETPVIFTTAFDQYAIEAFRVNSIDYLLKPIKTEDLKRALEKFRKLTRQDILKYLAQLSQMATGKAHRDKILIPVKDKLQPVSIEEVSCFYTTDKNTRVCMKNGSWHSYPGTLDQIESTLNPEEFIRANKQFIVARNSVKNLTIWFDSRLLVTLDVETPERIYVSKNRAAEFKAWIVRNT
jgi:DNA-binding LytR/AlgR family response regulator